MSLLIRLINWDWYLRDPEQTSTFLHVYNFPFQGFNYIVAFVAEAMLEGMAAGLLSH